MPRTDSNHLIAPPADGPAQPLHSVPAMLLAAGRGERMRPLTDTLPKPLLEVQGKSLLLWHMLALQQTGTSALVINTAWLGEKIEARFGNVLTPGASDAATPIIYSHEGKDFGGALETAGGICRALPRLGDMFWLVAGDIYAPDFHFDPQAVDQFTRSTALAHIWLVANPTHNPLGDFGLSVDGLALNTPKDSPTARYTYSTIGLYRRELFLSPWCEIPEGNPHGMAAPLAPLLRKAMDAQRVSASIYTGRWTDVGTPERLAQLNQPSFS